MATITFELQFENYFWVNFHSAMIMRVTLKFSQWWMISHIEFGDDTCNRWYYLNLIMMKIFKLIIIWRRYLELRQNFHDDIPDVTLNMATMDFEHDTMCITQWRSVYKRLSFSEDFYNDNTWKTPSHWNWRW